MLPPSRRSWKIPKFSAKRWAIDCKRSLKLWFRYKIIRYKIRSGRKERCCRLPWVSERRQGGDGGQSCPLFPLGWLWPCSEGGEVAAVCTMKPSQGLVGGTSSVTGLFLAVLAVPTPLLCSQTGTAGKSMSRKPLLADSADGRGGFWSNILQASLYTTKWTLYCLMKWGPLCDPEINWHSLAAPALCRFYWTWVRASFLGRIFG